MNRPTDAEIRRMIVELPRPEPPEGFADGVMDRVRAEERWRRRRPWFLAAAAVVLASALAISFGRESAAPVVAESAPADPREELAALQDEVRSLREAMALMDALRGAPGGDPTPSLRRARFPGAPENAGSPVVPLVRIGGDDDLGVFLDLESLLDGGGFPARPPSVSPRVLPVSDRTRR